MSSLKLVRTAVALALSVAFLPSASAGPASVWVYAFEGATPLRDVRITIGTQAAAIPNAQGAVGAALPAGEHRIEVRRGEERLAEFPLSVADDEQVQVSLAVYPNRAPVYTVNSNVHGKSTVDLGASAAAGAAAAGPADAGVASTDAAGAVDSDAAAESDLAASEPALTGEEVQLEGITVTAGAMPSDDRAAFVDEKRASADVKEAISAEEIARAGDSDVGTALKRVTGLTLVDGKFVYVRGIGERYSSVLLNNAQIPSPDPTRRVVPLDLFPTEILEGMIIQKSFSPERPAEFGGGTIQMRTKTVPDTFFLKVALGTGYSDGTTFEDGLRYEGGDDDWYGRDDGTRELPDSISDAIADGGVITEQSPTNPSGLTPEEIQQFGRDLSNVWDVQTEEIDPPVTGAFSIGNSWRVGDNRFGFLSAMRYDQKWDTIEEQRATFAPTSAGLVQTQGFQRDETERQVDLSSFLTLGAEFGANHRLRSNLMLLRQTTDQAQIDTGFDDSPDELSRFTELEWIENELRTFQVAGDHTLPALHDLGLSWQYSDSKASRYAPNTRRYRYDQITTDEGTRFRYSPRSNNNQVIFSDLDDDVEEIGAAFKLPFVVGDASFLDVYFGVDQLERTRDSTIRRYQYLSRGVIGNDPDVVFDPSLENVFGDPNIRPDGFVLREVTRGTDNYAAEQELDALYVNVDYNLNSKLRFTLGARREDNLQRVTTVAVGSVTGEPIVSTLEADDILPAFTTTWFIDDESQLRFAYTETLSRPDFRELSPAPFTDPLLDVESIGNPDLVQTDIKNADLRYEYYFSPSELISVALFYKDFERPIERVQVPATANLVSFFNAESATNYGVELDVFRSFGALREWGWIAEDAAFPWEQLFFGFNCAYIKSEVTLGDAQLNATNENRPLQGQSRYVTNLQLGYQHPEGKREVTLLYNVFGQRVAQVGIEGAPDIYEQPFGQLDLTYLERFSPEWALKVRLRNLLDDDVEFTQGEGVTRSYIKGREILFTLEWTPQM